MYTFNEKIEVVSQEDIEISKFDNELTDREYLVLKKGLINQNFTGDEINALNTIFGTYKLNFKNCTFELEFGGFGREIINFNGCINKYTEFDNNDKKLLNEFCYIIDGDIHVKYGLNIGYRGIHIALNNFRDVISFFENFESKIQINF